MNGQSAAEAIEAIIGTVPEGEPLVLSEATLARIGLVGEATGVVVASNTVGVETVEDTAPEAVEAPAPVTKESLAEQLPFAHKGYNTVIDIINDGRKKDKIAPATEETVREEYDAWIAEKEQDGSLAYVRAAMEADPELVATLDATPNVLVSGEEVTNAEVKFGEGQPYKTEVWSDILTRKSRGEPQYTPQEISGTDPTNGNSVMFSIRLSKPTPDMGSNRQQNIDRLVELQKVTPSLRFTTPLEAATHVQTLRAGGDKLVGNGTFEKTITRYPDMEPRRVGDFACVPDSCVGDGGIRSLGYSDVEYDDNVVVVVG
ncbi:MAG: hypothetical protein V4702_04070 [Patescibacteria group bacterium]